MKKKIIFLQLFKQTRKEIVILNECIVGRDTELQCKYVKMFSENRKFEKNILS